SRRPSTASPTGTRIGPPVAPTLAALALGRWLDRMFATRVFFSAPLLMLGAALGLWLAWRWMKAQQHGDRDD
ncbi:AtpZ/AtpI family protein, partial [Burkholderia pseudomallei]|uniref:AtpZ/AtpI family protein n=1 Tax=Burkholderia pseudomallei TaxID=28450 RepID=UPI002933C040